MWHIDKIAISYHFSKLITLVLLASLTNKCNFDKTICLCLEKKGIFCSPGCLFTATNQNDKTKRSYKCVLALLRSCHLQQVSHLQQWGPARLFGSLVHFTGVKLKAWHRSFHSLVIWLRAKRCLNDILAIWDYYALHGQVSISN